MRKVIILCMVFALIAAGCTQTAEGKSTETPSPEPTQTHEQETAADDGELLQTLSDWVLGTQYGIDSVSVDEGAAKVLIDISEDNYSKLLDYDFADIRNSMDDILSMYGLEGDYEIVFSNGEALIESQEQETEEAMEDEAQTSETVQQPQMGDTVNLIFIHHSVGENWLNAGLNQMLNDNRFHVADTYYGWRQMGDRTDTTDWPDWFSDDVMPQVYGELGNMTGYNDIEPAAGENTVIMFKSCYPNSEVGSSISDEKEIYNSLLGYFAAHPDKMFVLVTPPPMQSISRPDKTRELANWLVADDGWRSGYDTRNLFIFDFYNVLTAEDNHHMLVDGVEVHIVNGSSNTLYYDSAGDDHPNDEGSYKAAEEFVPLLIYWYAEFADTN